MRNAAGFGNPAEHFLYNILRTFSLLFDILLKIRSENALFLHYAEEVDKNVILAVRFWNYCPVNEFVIPYFYVCFSALSSQK